MNDFNKRTIFYYCLMWGIIMFFLFPYSNRIDYWQNIYNEAQESINSSYWQIRQMKDIFEGKYIWLAIDTRRTSKPIDFNGNEISPHIIDYDLLIDMDSINESWFDTIVIVKHYTNHSDTIKIALEDL